jgi:hypothetical protein
MTIFVRESLYSKYLGAIVKKEGGRYETKGHRALALGDVRLHNDELSH